MNFFRWGVWPGVHVAGLSRLQALFLAVLIRRADLAVHIADLTSHFSCIWLVGTLFEKFVKHEMPGGNGAIDLLFWVPFHGITKGMD
jgi:hypothetical protein